MVTSMKLVVLSRCRVSEPVVRSCIPGYPACLGCPAGRGLLLTGGFGDCERGDQIGAEDNVGSAKGEHQQRRNQDRRPVHEKNPISRPSMAMPVQSAIEI